MTKHEGLTYSTTHTAVQQLLFWTDISSEGNILIPVHFIHQPFCQQDGDRKVVLFIQLPFFLQSEECPFSLLSGIF